MSQDLTVVQVYIYAGTGAAHRLTEKRMLAIIEGMRPSLRAGDFDAALQRAVVDTGVVLNNGRIGDDTDWKSGFATGGVFFSVVGAIIGWSWWCAT